MKYKSFTILVFVICFVQACNEQQNDSKKFLAAPNQSVSLPVDSQNFITTYYTKQFISVNQYNNNKGYLESGELITNFDCQDDVKDFPPVNIKLWDKVAVVNGRLPSYEETKNGTAIHHYGEKENPYVKPYNMILPKLAIYHNYETKTNDDVVVIVIQIAQTPTDTVVSFRYLTGGCGGNTFSHFHFLTNTEVKKITQ
jgi:hypothetical protein